jgi:hypothetical protein
MRRNSLGVLGHNRTAQNKLLKVLRRNQSSLRWGQCPISFQNELRSPINRIGALENSSYTKSGVGDSAGLIGRCKFGANTHIVIFAQPHCFRCQPRLLNRFAVIIFHCVLRPILIPCKGLRVTLEMAEVLGVVASGISVGQLAGGCRWVQVACSDVSRGCETSTGQYKTSPRTSNKSPMR